MAKSSLERCVPSDVGLDLSKLGGVQVDKVLDVIAGSPDRPMVIGGIEIPCYVVEGDIRVLSQRGMLGAIGRSRAFSRHRKGGSVKIDDRPESDVDVPQFQLQKETELPPFLSANNLKPFISEALRVASNPVLFRLSESDDEPIAMGYRAELLPEICNVYLRAREADALLQSQQHIAAQSEILVRGLALTGVVALVDEATQFQSARQKSKLNGLPYRPP